MERAVRGHRGSEARVSAAAGARYVNEGDLKQQEAHEMLRLSFVTFVRRALVRAVDSLLEVEYRGQG
jgi:hypothetical protein